MTNKLFPPHPFKGKALGTRLGRAHNPPPPPPGEVLLFDKPCRFLRPKRVGCLRHFGMESGTVFEGTTGLHECICHSNSKWVRKKENCANSKWILTACVASVSVWFRSKERPRSGIFDFGHERNEISAKKWKRGEGKGKEGNFAIFPTPSPRFYLRHFWSVPRSLLLNRAETLATQDRVLKNIFVALLV